MKKVKLTVDQLSSILLEEDGKAEVVIDGPYIGIVIGDSSIRLIACRDRVDLEAACLLRPLT